MVGSYTTCYSRSGGRFEQIQSSLTLTFVAAIDGLTVHPFAHPFSDEFADLSSAVVAWSCVHVSTHAVRRESSQLMEGI